MFVFKNKDSCLFWSLSLSSNVSQSLWTQTYILSCSVLHLHTNARTCTRMHTHTDTHTNSSCTFRLPISQTHPEPCRHFLALSFTSDLVSSSPHSLLLSLLLSTSPSSFSHRVAAPHLSLTSNNLCLRQHGAPVNTDARLGCLATCLPVSGRCQPQEKTQDQ